MEIFPYSHAERAIQKSTLILCDEDMFGSANTCINTCCEEELYKVFGECKSEFLDDMLIYMKVTNRIHCGILVVLSK